MIISNTTLITLLTLLGTLIIINFIYKKIKARYLAKHTTKIIYAHQGKKIILKGKVQQFNNLMVAPLSKQPCLGYLYLVIKRGRNIDSLIYREAKGTDFILDDGTGKCLIFTKSPGIFYNSPQWPPTIKFSNQVTIEEAIKQDDLSEHPNGKIYRHMEYRRQEEEIVYVEGFIRTDLKDLNLSPFHLQSAMINKRETPVIITPAYTGSIIPLINKFKFLDDLPR